MDKNTRYSTEIIEPKNKNVTILKENVTDEKIKYFNPKYVKQQIKKIEKARDQVLIQFLFYTGLRITEAIRLKKLDLDFENNMAKVHHLKRNKINKRKIPIKSELMMILKLYTTKLNQKDKLFPISRQHGYRIVKKHLGGSPHMLRHTFAINYLNKGGQVVKLSRLLGHKSVRTTMVYLDITPVDLQVELEKLDL